MSSFGKSFTISYQKLVDQIMKSKKEDALFGAEVYEKIAFLLFLTEEFGVSQEEFPKMVEWELFSLLLDSPATDRVENSFDTDLEKLQEWFLPFGEECFQYYKDLWLEMDLGSLSYLQFLYLEMIAIDFYHCMNHPQEKGNFRLEKLSFLLENSSHASLADCLHFVLEMKNTLRKGWVIRGVEPDHLENDAEHTLQMLWMCSIYYHAKNPELDLGKLYEMIAIHDLGETVIGDIPVVDQEGQKTKKERENAAVERIFAGHRQGEKLLDLWKDFDKKISEEAQLVYQLDKLDPILKAEFLDREENRSDLTPDFYFYEEGRHTFQGTDIEEVGQVIKKKMIRKSLFKNTPQVQSTQFHKGSIR